MGNRVSSIPAEPTVHEALTSRGVLAVPSTPNDRADLLDGTDWSRQFEWAEIASLARKLGHYQLSTGRALFHEGDHDAFLGLVTKGRLDIHKLDLAGEDRVVGQVGPRKMVGEMSLLDRGARSATAIAAEPTEILVLTASNFEAICVEHPTVGIKLVRAIATAIAQLLRQTTGSLVELLHS